MGRLSRVVRRADELATAAVPSTCWLCERPLGTKVERHHPVLKSRGGRVTAPVHPICHRTVHARFTNKELERVGDDVTAVRRDEEIARFLGWVAGKEPDFHALVRRRQAKRADR